MLKENRIKCSLDVCAILGLPFKTYSDIFDMTVRSVAIVKDYYDKGLISKTYKIKVLREINKWENYATDIVTLSISLSGESIYE